MLGAAARQWEQLGHTFTFMPGLSPSRVANVVYAAMGSSAIPGLIAPLWPGVTVPFEVVRGYEIPAYVNGDTLFIACSYSGNTEETVAAIGRAVEAGAQAVVVTSGGKLAEIARQRGYPLALLPETQYPRLAKLYTLKAIVMLLSQVDVSVADEAALQASAEFLRAATEAWLPIAPTTKNLAKQIARECMGKSAAVYAGPKMSPAARTWKIAINENAKQVAWWGELPEFSHNELAGWSKQPEQKPYAVIALRSNLEHPRVQKRFELTERLLSGLWPAPTVIEPSGDTLLQQLLWAVLLGDFVSIYLALLNGLDPMPLPLADKLKSMLAS